MKAQILVQIDETVKVKFAGEFNELGCPQNSTPNFSLQIIAINYSHFMKLLLQLSRLSLYW
jgi:hypothetical protein